MHEKWPETGEINELNIKASCYLMEMAHSFRVYLKTYMALKKPGKAKTIVVAPEKPNKATVWVAKTFPQWQNIVLTTMKKMHDVCCITLVYTHVI